MCVRERMSWFRNVSILFFNQWTNMKYEFVVWFRYYSVTGKWFRIKRRHAVFLCWMYSNHGSLGHQIASRLNAQSQYNTHTHIYIYIYLVCLYISYWWRYYSQHLLPDFLRCQIILTWLYRYVQLFDSWYSGEDNASTFWQNLLTHARDIYLYICLVIDINCYWNTLKEKSMYTKYVFLWSGCIPSHTWFHSF